LRSNHRASSIRALAAERQVFRDTNGSAQGDSRCRRFLPRSSSETKN
jgi:hypothetical protein